MHPFQAAFLCVKQTCQLSCLKGNRLARLREATGGGGKPTTMEEWDPPVVGDTSCSVSGQPRPSGSRLLIPGNATWSANVVALATSRLAHRGKKCTSSAHVVVPMIDYDKLSTMKKSPNLLVVLGLMGCTKSNLVRLQRRRKGPSGQKAMAPDFELENVAGERLKSKDLKGKIIVVDFRQRGAHPAFRDPEL